LSHKSFTNKLREIWAKYPFHPKKIASSYTRNVSVFFGGSEYVNAAILSKELFVCADKHQGLLFYQLEYEKARTQGRRSPPRKIFARPGRMCWTYFKANGHSLKIFSPS